MAELGMLGCVVVTQVFFGWREDFEEEDSDEGDLWVSLTLDLDRRGLSSSFVLGSVGIAGGDSFGTFVAPHLLPQPPLLSPLGPIVTSWKTSSLQHWYWYCLQPSFWSHLTFSWQSASSSIRCD